jgi:hypothetical protein
MKKTFILTVFGIVALILSACSKEANKKENVGVSATSHSYIIEISGGKTYTGEVPSYAAGVVEVYNPVTFVEYSEETGSKVLSGMLQEAGKFQFGIGLALDSDNKPSLQGSGPGLVFGEWGTADKYRPAGNISMTLKDYREHNISMYGETGTVASYTLTFSGKFRLGTAGEEVEVTGELVVAAP